MVWEIFRLFRLKSGVPKWPCHSTYIFIAIIFVHRTWHLHWRVSSSWVDSDPWPMLGWKGWTFWMFQDRTKFSTFSKLGKWSDEMRAPRNIPTATASQRVEESKVDLRQKSQNVVSIKKNEVSRQNKVLNILNIRTGKMILWHACSQELNLLSEKRNFKKKHKICAWKDDTYIAFWEVAKYQGIRGKYRAISEKRWKV